MAKNRKHPPHFMLPANRSASGPGYTTTPQRPLPHAGDTTDGAEEAARVAERTRPCDEPEMVGPAIIDAYGDLARTYNDLRRRAEIKQAEQDRRLLTAEQRLVNAKHQAKRRHLNLSREFHVIEKILTKARKGGRGDAAATAKLERVEAQIDGKDLLDAA